MLALLVYVAENSPANEVYMEVAANAPSGSPLRTIIAQMVVDELDQNGHAYLSEADIEELGSLGFTNELLRAQSMQHKWQNFPRKMMSADAGMVERYGGYLLGDLDEDHGLVRWLEYNI